MTLISSVKQTSHTIGREINHVLETLSEGWHELFSHSSNALTQFTRHKTDEHHANGESISFPNWSLLAGELEETSSDIVVRVELPGLDREEDDCQICIEDNVLYLSGEKRFEREAKDSTYHLMERAYGAFRRSIPLPSNVNIDQVEASFKNGVLTVRLPKVGSDEGRSIAVS